MTGNESMRPPTAETLARADRYVRSTAADTARRSVNVAEYDRRISLRQERVAYVDQLCVTHNRCAWCGEARVEPGQPLCLRCAHFVSIDDLTVPA